MLRINQKGGKLGAGLAIRWESLDRCRTPTSPCILLLGLLLGWLRCAIGYLAASMDGLDVHHYCFAYSYTKRQNYSGEVRQSEREIKLVNILGISSSFCSDSKCIFHSRI